MKISQMTTTEGANCLIKIMEPVCHILADEEFVRTLEELQALDSAHPIESITAAVMKVLPYLLERHRDDTFAVIGALSGKTKAQIAKQKFLETVRDVVDSADKDLIDFFHQLRPQTKEAES